MLFFPQTINLLSLTSLLPTGVSLIISISRFFQIEITLSIVIFRRSGVDSIFQTQTERSFSSGHSWHANGIMRGFKATVESVDAFSNKDSFLRKVFLNATVSVNSPSDRQKPPPPYLEYHSVQSLHHLHHFRHHKCGHVIFIFILGENKISRDHNLSATALPNIFTKFCHLRRRI